MEDNLLHTGVIYCEDGSVREIFQHKNEKDIHDMIAYILSLNPNTNLTSKYIGRVNNHYKNAEGRTYSFEKGKFLTIEEWR
jgi:hypothetical protein|tara:strand:- start:50 stop:292 length:243 start_codon:yes stop_codon:yes gene_type:complete